MGGIIGCQVSNYFKQQCGLQEEVVIVLGHRDIATADDEDHAHIFVCQILGVLKEGKHSNHLQLAIMVTRSWLQASILH